MIPTELFGRTGHQSTRTIFGAAALSDVTQEEADRTMELLLRFGVNHIDTAASYGDSELRLGPWLEQHRADVFLATKTGERTSQAAYDQIRRSLERLRVDQVDLIQLHNLVEPDEWETALGPGGALEAAIQAREEGLVRFIGVTGHGTTVAAMHTRALERFDFDSGAAALQLPDDAEPELRRRLRGAGRSLPGAGRGRADDQGHHASPLGRPAADSRHLVRAPARPGRHRPRRALGARPARGVPQHGWRHRGPASSARCGRPLPGAAVRRGDARDRRAAGHGAAVRLSGRRTGAE